MIIWDDIYEKSDISSFFSRKRAAVERKLINFGVGGGEQGSR